MQNTILGVLGFYWRCLKRALSGKFGIAENWVGVFTIIALGVAYFLRPEPELETWLNIKLPFWLFSIVYLSTVFVGFITAPYFFYEEQRERTNRLEERLKPKLEVALANGANLTKVNWGSTSVTVGGDKFTTIVKREDVVCLLCRNVSSAAVTGAETRLLEAWRLIDGVEVGLGIVESIQLPWDREAISYPTAVTIQPAEVKRIYLAVVRPNGAMNLYRDLKTLPIEYHRLFMEKGTYKLKLQISGDNVPPSEVILYVETMEEEQMVNRIRIGIASLKLA